VKNAAYMIAARDQFHHKVVVWFPRFCLGCLSFEPFGLLRFFGACEGTCGRASCSCSCCM